MKISIIAMAAFAAASVSAVPAAASVNLVTNGDFETATNKLPGDAGKDFEVSPGNTYGTVAGWSTSSSPSGNPYNILFHSSIAATAAGNAVGQYSFTNKEYLNALPSNNGTHGNFMALDGDPAVNGNFYQQITGLTVGAVYDLSFDWATGQIASRTGATNEALSVTIGGTTFNLPSRNTPSGGATDWATYKTQFTATSTSELLSFLATSTSGGLPPVALLDNVSITRAVPEPATWAMMLLGFGAIGVSMRRRRKSGLAIA